MKSFSLHIFEEMYNDKNTDVFINFCRENEITTEDAIWCVNEIVRRKRSYLRRNVDLKNLTKEINNEKKI